MPLGIAIEFVKPQQRMAARFIPAVSIVPGFSNNPS